MTTVEKEKCFAFNTLKQKSDESVRAFYARLKCFGRTLDISNELIEYQFYCGLSCENRLEAERITNNVSIEELIKILEKVERRKAELRSYFRKWLNE